jgi:hypothetical protein
MLQKRDMVNYRAWCRLNYARNREKIRIRQKADYDCYRQAGFFYRSVNGKRRWVRDYEEDTRGDR